MTAKSTLGDSYDVLLVEDNAEDAAIVEYELAAAGEGVHFAIRRAETLEDALGALWSDAPDVVLLDLSLPDSAGLQTLELLRIASPKTAVVVYAGDADDDLGLQAVKLGAQDVINKGAGNAAIARSIRHAVARQRRPHSTAGGPIWSSVRATHDPVTGLANRYLFLDRLHHALTSARRYRESLGLLTIRISLGFEGSTELPPELSEGIAAEIGRRLHACTRRSDTVARIESDLYAVIMERARSHTGVRAHVDEMARRLESTMIWTRQRVRIRAQCGLAFFPNESTDPDGLLDASLQAGALLHA